MGKISYENKMQIPTFWVWFLDAEQLLQIVPERGWKLSLMKSVCKQV